MSRAGKAIGAGKYMVWSGGLEFGHHTAQTIRTAARAAAIAQAMSQASRSLLFAAPANGAVPAVDAPLSPTHCSSLARSLVLCHRSSGALARHFFTAWSNPGGVMGFTALMGSGSFSR